MTAINEINIFYGSYIKADDKGAFLQEALHSKSFLCCRKSQKQKFHKWYQECSSTLGTIDLTALRALRLLAALFSEDYAVDRIDRALDSRLESRKKHYNLTLIAHQIEKDTSSYGLRQLTHNTPLSNLPGILACGALIPKVAPTGMGAILKHGGRSLFFSAFLTSSSCTDYYFQTNILEKDKAILIFSPALVSLSKHLSYDHHYGKLHPKDSFIWEEMFSSKVSLKRRLDPALHNEVVFPEDAEVPLFPFLKEIWVANEEIRIDLLKKIDIISCPHLWDDLIVVRQKFPE